MMNILASKGNKHLVKYESGLYAVEKITKTIGMTLFASESKIEAVDYFNNLKGKQTR